MSAGKGIGIVLALTAGMMAAFASTSAKLAMSAEEADNICKKVSQTWFVEDVRIGMFCGSVASFLRLACFAGIFLFNALMWTFYTKSLQHCSSTLEATVTNTGANFLFTALIGVTLFREHLSIFWWIGSCLIFAGLVLIHRGNKGCEENELKKQ